MTTARAVKLCLGFTLLLTSAGCNEEDVRSGARDQDLKDAALAECQRWAATKNFAWDECLEDYATDEWLFVVTRAEGEDAELKTPGFDCYGDD